MTMTTSVYFMQSADGGPIKIGLSADPTRRAKQLSTSAPIEVLASIPGGRDLEQRMHALFAAGRLHGEWFDEDTVGLAEVIEAAMVLWAAIERFGAAVEMADEATALVAAEVRT